MFCSARSLHPSLESGAITLTTTKKKTRTRTIRSWREMPRDKHRYMSPCAAWFASLKQLHLLSPELVVSCMSRYVHVLMLSRSFSILSRAVPRLRQCGTTDRSLPELGRPWEKHHSMLRPRPPNYPLSSGSSKSIHKRFTFVIPPWDGFLFIVCYKPAEPRRVSRWSLRSSPCYAVWCTPGPIRSLKRI